MPVNQFTQADAELLLNCAWPVDMSADAVKLGAMVVLAAKLRKPLWPSAQDGGCNSHCFYIGDCRGAAVQANIGREGRLESRFPLFAFQRLYQCSLFTCSHKMQHESSPAKLDSQSFGADLSYGMHIELRQSDVRLMVQSIVQHMQLQVLPLPHDNDEIKVLLLGPTANVCTCSIVHNNVKVIATAAGIFANEPLVICLRHCSLQSQALCHILSPA